MKHSEGTQQQPSLYLEVCSQDGEPRLPLHSSIVLFLLSYCHCKSFKVFLAARKPLSWESLRSRLPSSLEVWHLGVEDLPRLVRGCRLPAALDESGRLCRAGLAVVLRHIVNTTVHKQASRTDLLQLLGFKKTCLKACAEVSQWTRLCEIGVPSAVEDHLRDPSDQNHQLPPSILALERRLAEPVRVHNDDKIRRQKLREQKQSWKKEDGENPGGNRSPESGVCDGLEVQNPESGVCDGLEVQSSESGVCDGLELRAALAKLCVDAVPAAATREHCDIRKVRTADLPPLEHVFAEGLYFTLTDVVLLPCIFQYLHSVQTHAAAVLRLLPRLLRWSRRVQEVPGVLPAAQDCGLPLATPTVATPTIATPTIATPTASAPAPELDTAGVQELEDGQQTSTRPPLVGGPRPTMTKLKENGVEAVFSPHPRPAWTLCWDQLPAAINPAEGKMSNVRAVRKMQQLNNLVAMVTELARPGDTVVDFCSGTGHVGIVLAHTLPHCQVVLVENKEESLVRAQRRAAALRLENIGFIQANLDYFTAAFQIGVALHACGVATDMVMDQCVQAGAAFVISPCCYGFIQNAVKFSFPKSKKFKEILTYKEHMILCRFADQTAAQLPPERRLTGKRCMGLVDLDRSWAAEDHGYSVQVMTMEPESCSPKNNMLVGRPTPTPPPPPSGGDDPPPPSGGDDPPPPSGGDDPPPSGGDDPPPPSGGDDVGSR